MVMRTCRGCSHPISSEAVFCPHCGAVWPDEASNDVDIRTLGRPKKWNCPECAELVGEVDRICFYCGLVRPAERAKAGIWWELLPIGGILLTLWLIVIINKRLGLEAGSDVGYLLFTVGGIVVVGVLFGVRKRFRDSRR